MYKQLYQFMRLMKPGEFRTRRYIQEFERNQWLNPEELQQISWQKLKKLLEHAYTHVPFYRQRFQEIGLTPQDIQTEKDFYQIPLLSKDDIRQNGDLLLATNYDKSRMTRDATSGSTGEPLVLYRAQDYSSADIAAFTRSYRWFGGDMGDKIAWIWGRRQDGSRLTLMQRIKRERWLDGYTVTPEIFQQFAQMLGRWKPTIITGYGNVIYLFAEYLAQQNIRDIRPKMVQTTAVPVWPHEREVIERVFQCPVSDRYSSHEAGAIIAAECPQGGKHIFSDFCFVEILADGQPVSPGEMGEVVITPLYNFGMPLIRYQMADIAALAGQPCSCGRGLPVLQELMGRATSMFTLPSGKLLYGGVFRRVVLHYVPGIQRFRIHQHAPNKIEIVLQIKERPCEDIINSVRQQCLPLIENESVELIISVTDEIPMTAAGKFLVTTSDVPVTLN